MKLRVHFGTIHTEEVNWWKPLPSFPNIIKFRNKNYKWFVYELDKSGAVDQILVYAELLNYDPNYNVICAVWEEMFKEEDGCRCGAKFTSFPNGHMFFCPKWIRW